MKKLYKFSICGIKDHLMYVLGGLCIVASLFNLNIPLCILGWGIVGAAMLQDLTIIEVDV